MTGVALTGLGLVTPFGVGPGAFRAGLLAGASAIGPLTRFADPARAGDPRERVAAQIDGSVCGAPVGGLKSRLTETVVAQALRRARLPRLPDGALTVIAGQTPVSASPTAFARDFESPRPGAATGPVVQVPHACASSAFGLALARDWLLSGGADVALVVGVVTLNPYDFSSMDLVRAQSGRGAAPFDVRRDGMTLGEGGGAVVLETFAHARARGIDPGIALTGAACLISGGSVADSQAEAIGACVAESLDQAGTTEVDYVHAHATGTPQGDAAELAALDATAARLGWSGVPVGSHKGAIGHLLHASTMPAVAAAVGFLRTGIAPGTPGLTEPIAAERMHVAVDPVRTGRARHVLVDGFGFYGNYASLVVSRVPGGPAPDGRVPGGPAPDGRVPAGPEPGARHDPAGDESREAEWS
ncbi:beta-ketoacyl synthase N-terminal-like domain-containing protein [Kitasatospora sp. NPDC101447]|uniref:beta-ketoacyl synthase N-terminal-like domain-containing protein n=1 Tax=Kitasatospora sp. NPDC101447 TaxID=3364102 RepID=UPI003815ABFD